MVIVDKRLFFISMENLQLRNSRGWPGSHNEVTSMITEGHDLRPLLVWNASTRTRPPTSQVVLASYV